MSDQFQPGDVVECVEGDPSMEFYRGDIYTVKRVLQNGTMQVDGVSGSWFTHMFQAVRRAEQKQETDPVMTLRDQFAMAALAHVPKMLEVNGINLSAEMIAKHAYGIADAMLAERAKKEGER